MRSLDSVRTRTGSTVHYGVAFGGAVQTECGIGYGKRAYGRAIVAPVTCKRCAAMVAARA